MYKKFAELLRWSAAELDAGNCNLSEAEMLDILTKLQAAHKRSGQSVPSLPSSDAIDPALLARLEDGFCHLYDKVDELQGEVDIIKGGGRVVNLRKSK